MTWRHRLVLLLAGIGQRMMEPIQRLRLRGYHQFWPTWPTFPTWQSVLSSDDCRNLRHACQRLDADTGTAWRNKRSRVQILDGIVSRGGSWKGGRLQREPLLEHLLAVKRHDVFTKNPPGDHPGAPEAAREETYHLGETGP